MTKFTLSRREFLIGATAATAAVWLTAEELAAQESAGTAPAGPPVNCAVIGCGIRGKELLTALARFPNAAVTGICDTYEPFLTRGKESAPNAATLLDYMQILGKKEIEAVFVATPSGLHKDIVLAALQAGKHVYCEAPMAIDVDDCKAMAKASLGEKQIFQIGQQLRANPMRKHVSRFVKSGSLGDMIEARAQWHKRQSWKRAAATPEREAELNWKVSSKTSAGLIGEVGLHQIDLMSWYMAAVPTCATGVGSVMAWKDGRDVADTVQCVIEYPNGARMLYDATLGNSFDGDYELLQGTYGAILMRRQHAWMVREADSPMLDWEVYARKEKIGDESGIVLLADSTKLIAEGKEPGKDAVVDTTKDELYYSVEEFLTNVRAGSKPSCGPQEGYRAAVTAIKVNEAVVNGSKIIFQKEWFDLA
ncbi:MAG: Gfo/Idh/MocA family oxidoreductase [Armatimonadota bacterium]|nr:Gfo/Idh/MocA family oxidoreductase [Armatimonadota bacterium]